MITWTSDAPPRDPSWTTILSYDGSGLTEYIGLARSTQPENAVSVTSFSKASPGVVTHVAHGLATGNRVKFSGCVNAGWTNLNGTSQIITVIDADTFSIPVNTTAYTGSFDGVMTTTAPRTSQPIWSITRQFYNGSNQFIRLAKAVGSAAARNIWDNRTSLAYE